MTLYKAGLFFLSALILVLTVSCGENVCIAGLGGCEIPKDLQEKQKKGSTQTGPRSVGALKPGIQTDSFNLNPGEKITFTGIGGKPPYKYTVSSGDNTGEIGEKDGLYTAPYPAPNQVIKAKVKITDSEQQSVEIQIDIR